MDSSKRFSTPWSDLPLSERARIAANAPNVNSKAGMTRALFEATKFDDQLYSKQFEQTFNQAKAAGLIDRADAREIEKYRTNRVVELYNEGKGRYFVGREFRPDLTEDIIAEQHTDIKADLRNAMDFERNQRFPYELKQMGYDPQDFNRFVNDKSGYRDLPLAGRVEIPFLSQSFKQDPLKEIGIGMYQSGRIAAGIEEGALTPFEAIGRRMLGQDPGQALRETGNPLIDSGQIMGESAVNRAATIPYGILGSRILTPGASALFGAAATGLGSALGGAKMGARFGPVGSILGGVMGGIAGMVGGSMAGEFANEKIADLALGRDANAQLKATRESLQTQYPFATRVGEEAPDLAMFGPSLNVKGFSAKKALSGIKQAGLPGAIKGVRNQNEMISDLSERFGEGAMNVVFAARQSDREKANGGPGKTAWDILAEGAMGVIMQGETRLGQKVYGGLNNKIDTMSQAALTRMAKRLPIEPGAAPKPVTRMPEGMMRINLGGRLQSATDAQGNPVIKGARYAVYDPAKRKAYIYTDNDFALAGERTKAAAFSLGGTDNVFRRNPILTYSDKGTGSERMILGITRDAGVVVRDINPTGQSTVSVVPVSEIRNEPINKRLIESMASQGVKPNPAPAPFMPDVFTNADKSVFPDTVSLDSNFQAIPARVVSKLGGKATNAYMVALPDGTHIRVNGAMINTKGAEPIVRGKISEDMFPQSLSDLMPQRKPFERHVRIGTGDDETRLQLTEAGFGKAWRQVGEKFAGARQAILREPDAQKREIAIDMLHNQIANEIDKAGLFTPPTLDIKPGSVIQIQMPSSGPFTGQQRMQDAIVVGKNRYGHEVILPNYQQFGTFTISDADVDPASALMAAMDISPEAKVPVSTKGEIQPPKQKQTREGANLEESPQESENAKYVDYQTQPDTIRKKIDEAVGQLFTSDESPIGRTVEVNDASEDTHIHARVTMHNPGRITYHLRTTEFDPASRAQKDQYVTTYEALYDPDKDEWSISSVSPSSVSIPSSMEIEAALWNIGDLAKLSPTDYSTWFKDNNYKFKSKTEETIYQAGFRFATFLQAKYGDTFIKKDTKTVQDLDNAAAQWRDQQFSPIVNMASRYDDASFRRQNFWSLVNNYGSGNLTFPTVLIDPNKLTIDRWIVNPNTGQPYPTDTDLDMALIPDSAETLMRSSERRPTFANSNDPTNFLGRHMIRVNAQRAIGTIDNYTVVDKAVKAGRIPEFVASAILAESIKVGYRTTNANGQINVRSIAIDAKNDMVPVVLTNAVLVNAGKKLMAGTPAKDALYQAYTEWIQSSEPTDKKNGWIVLPKRAGSAAAGQLQKLTAGTQWCVGQKGLGYDASYRRSGDFHIYMENGRALIGIGKQYEGANWEIHGDGPGQSLTPYDRMVSDKYIASGAIPGWQGKSDGTPIINSLVAIYKSVTDGSVSTQDKYAAIKDITQRLEGKVVGKLDLPNDVYLTQMDNLIGNVDSDSRHIIAKLNNIQNFRDIVFKEINAELAKEKQLLGLNDFLNKYLGDSYSNEIILDPQELDFQNLIKYVENAPRMRSNLVVIDANNGKKSVDFNQWVTGFEKLEFKNFRLEIPSTVDPYILERTNARESTFVFDYDGKNSVFLTLKLTTNLPRRIENFRGRFNVGERLHYGDKLFFKNSVFDMASTQKWANPFVPEISLDGATLRLPTGHNMSFGEIRLAGSPSKIDLYETADIRKVFNYNNSVVSFDNVNSKETGIKNYYGIDPVFETSWVRGDRKFADYFHTAVDDKSLYYLLPNGEQPKVIDIDNGFAGQIETYAVEGQIINLVVSGDRPSVGISNVSNFFDYPALNRPPAVMVNLIADNSRTINIIAPPAPQKAINFTVGKDVKNVYIEKSNGASWNVVNPKDAEFVSYGYIHRFVDSRFNSKQTINTVDVTNNIIDMTAMNSINEDLTDSMANENVTKMLSNGRNRYFDYQTIFNGLLPKDTVIPFGTTLTLDRTLSLPIDQIRYDLENYPQKFTKKEYEFSKAFVDLFTPIKTTSGLSGGVSTDRIPEVLHFINNYKEPDVINSTAAIRSKFEAVGATDFDIAYGVNTALASSPDTVQYIDNGSISRLQADRNILKLTGIPNYSREPTERFRHFVFGNAAIAGKANKSTLQNMYNNITAQMRMLENTNSNKFRSNTFTDPTVMPNNEVLDPLTGRVDDLMRQWMMAYYNITNLNTNLPFWQYQFVNSVTPPSSYPNASQTMEYHREIMELTQRVIKKIEDNRHKVPPLGTIWYTVIRHVKLAQKDLSNGVNAAYNEADIVHLSWASRRAEQNRQDLELNIANMLGSQNGFTTDDWRAKHTGHFDNTNYEIGEVRDLYDVSRDWSKVGSQKANESTDQNRFALRVPESFINDNISNSTDNRVATVYSDYISEPYIATGALFQTNEPDAGITEPGQPSERPKSFKRKAFFSARIPTSADFKSFYKEYARIEHQFADDPAGMKRELNKLYAAYRDIIKTAMPQILDILDKAARQERPMLKSRDIEFTKDRQGYVLRKWKGQDLTALTGRADLAGTGNPKEIHSVLANIAGNNYLVNVQTVSNSVQLSSVLREQYRFDPDAADGVAEVVDRFARAWALEKVKTQTGRSLDTVELTGKLAASKAAKLPSYSTSSEDLLFKRMARTEPEILKATAEYMREFYRERFAAFGVIDKAHDFDSKYKGAIFRATKKDSLAFNIIVGFASRDQSTGIHEIAHALLRSMTNEMRGAVIKSMMAHNVRVTENTDAEGNVRLPVDIEEMWATAFEASLMRKRVPVQYGAYNPNAKNQADPTLVKVWNDIGEYLRGTHEIAIAKLESQGKAVDAEAYQHKVQWYAPLRPDQRLFKKMGVVAKLNGIDRHATVTKAQATIDSPVEVLFDNGTAATIQRSDIIRLGGWTGGFNDATLDVISNWLGSYYADTPGKLGQPDKPGHRTKMQTSFPELFADYDPTVINMGQITGKATEAARYQEVTPDDVHQAVSAISPMSMQEYTRLVNEGIMPKMRDGRYLSIDKQVALARATMAENMAFDGKPNWNAAVMYVPTLGTNASAIKSFTASDMVTKRELVELARLLDNSLDPDVLFHMLSRLSSAGIPNVQQVFFDSTGKGKALRVPVTYAPTLAAIGKMRQDGMSLAFASQIFANKIDKSVTETYITPDEFDTISMQVMGVKYSDRDVRRIFNDLNLIPHLVRDKRTNAYAFLPQHVTILKAVSEARKQQVSEFEGAGLKSGQTYKVGPSWAKIKERLINNGDFVTAYNYIVNHPQYVSKGRELTLTPLTQHGDKKSFHGNSYSDVESTGLFQTNDQPAHPSTKIASLSSDNQIRTALATIIGQGRVQYDGKQISAVMDRNGNKSNVHRLLTKVHGYDQRTALGLYAMTETADFKKWSGSHPIIESVSNEDVRPDTSISQMTSYQRTDVRRYLSGKAVLAVLNNASVNPITDNDVETMAIHLQDYYRSSNYTVGQLTEQINDLFNSPESLIAFQTSIENELRGPQFDNVRNVMRSADDYVFAAQTPRTGKGIVTLAMDPSGSARYLTSLKGYVMPSGVTAMDGNGLSANYIRLDNPQVKDMKGKGITAPQVEAMLDNAVKAKRDGLILLNVNHTVGGNAVLHNIVIPRNKHSLRPIDVHPKVSLASYFSGGGLLEVGSKTFAVPALAVEYDKKIARVYAENHGDHVLATDVLSIDPESLKGVQWFHASPVCTDVSNAKTVGRIAGADRSTDRDRDFARAVARVIQTAKPPIVTIENTEAYARTSALKIITDALEGYTYDIGVYNAKDYGSPTDRKRLFVRAMLMPSNGVLPPVPGKHVTQRSWMDAIQDILPSMPVDINPQVNKRMTESLRRNGMDWNNVPYPVLVQQTQNWVPRGPDKPAPTIVASDGQMFRVVMPGGLVYKLNKDAVRRLQGLPDDFVLPNTHGFAQKIIGNGIPPQLTHALVSPLVKNHIDGRIRAAADGFANAQEPALFNTAYDPVNPSRSYKYVETHEDAPGAPYYVQRITPRSAPTTHGRLWNVLDQINDISRLVLSGDLAFATLQAGIIGLSNPRVGIKAFWAGLHGFAPNLQIELGGQKYGYGKIGREVFHKIGDGMRAHPLYNVAREAGLPLSMFEIDDRVMIRKEELLHNLRETNPEATIDDIEIDLMDIDELGANDEWYMKGRFTQHLPMQGQFERFNVIMHDTVLLTQFDNWTKVLLSKGYEPGTEKFNNALKDAARILSVAIGDVKYSTDTQKDATASRFAKVLFTAPRWLMSRALIDPMLNPILSNSAIFSKLREVMGEDNPAFNLYAGNKDVSLMGQSMWWRLAGAQLALIVMALIYQNWNPDVEVDLVRNPLRVRVGDFRMDPVAGQFDHAKLALRLATALLTTDQTVLKKAEREGIPLWLYQMKDVTKEMQYKMSPMLNTALSMLGGNDYQGFYNDPFGAVMSGRSLSVVGSGYFNQSDTAQTFYDTMLKPSVEAMFGKKAADSVTLSNAIVERMPTLFPQMFDAMERAMDYDRPVAAYVLANTIPNWIGLKVEIAPAEELKNRIRNKNAVSAEESPTIVKLLSQGRVKELFTGTKKVEQPLWGLQ